VQEEIRNTNTFIINSTSNIISDCSETREARGVSQKTRVQEEIRTRCQNSLKLS